MKKIRLLAILTVMSFALLSAPSVYAKDHDKKNTNKTASQVPIDGGIIILLVAGAGLGAKKLMNRKHKKVQE